MTTFAVVLLRLLHSARPLAEFLRRQQLVKDRLNCLFDTCLQSTDSPAARLFTDTCNKSLPLREIAYGVKMLKQCEHFFWATVEDTGKIGRALENATPQAAAPAQYCIDFGSKPTCSGKSAMIAAASGDSTKNVHKFEHSEFFSHNIHAPLSNNPLKILTYSSQRNSMVQLLLGVNSEQANELNEHVDDLIVVGPNTYTADLETLLRAGQAADTTTKETDVYQEGCSRFRSVSESTPCMGLTGTKLEAAYSWTLSCRSALYEQLRLSKDHPPFQIRCRALEAARLFATSHIDGEFAVPEATDKMYYAEENVGGKATHPLADFFFRTKQDELVLVDFTGIERNAELHVNKKFINHKRWVDVTSKMVVPQKLNLVCKSFILAPNDPRDSFNQGNVFVVRGSEARELLGGLQQCLTHSDIDSEI